MRPIRYFTGVLTLSLLSSVMLSGIFHSQQKIVAHESHHQEEHFDSRDTDEIAGKLNPNATGKECHESTEQVVIASPAKLRLAQGDAVGTMPFVFVGSATSRGKCSRIFLGRTAPLFEHASLFAATISMRV